MKPEIRKDYIQEKYVIIAPKRGKRPHNTRRLKTTNYSNPDQCVFCPANISKAGQTVLTVKSSSKKWPWAIKVIKNKFPAVSTDNKKAYGVQEVVVETPDHIKELEDLSNQQVADILKVYANRTKAISKNKKIKYILIFKNDGGSAGASIQHAHSQIFATEFLPPHLLDKSQKTQAYKLNKGRCVYCDVIEKEKKGPRLIYEDKNLIAFCPWASIYNYEVWIITKRHLDNITLLNKSERLSMAKIMKKILKKIGQLGLSYNYYFHQVLDDKDQHLYMKITPRGSVWAGVEIGSGLIINPIVPKEAAIFYKK